MKTDHILQRALDFWRNAGCKDSTNSYTGISTVFIENPCCKKGIEQPLSPNYIKQIFNKLRVVLKGQLYLKLLKKIL